MLILSWAVLMMLWSVFVWTRANWVLRTRERWRDEQWTAYRILAPTFDFMLYRHPFTWSRDLRHWARLYRGESA